MPSFLLIQWGVVGFFVLINFLWGFKRGSSKSIYFTIVNIFLAIVVLFLISSISLNLIFTDAQVFAYYVELIEGLSGFTIPQEFRSYIYEPELVAFLIAILDLVLRIVLFFSLYPIIKGFFRLIIFRPIWSFGIKKALLRKQNVKLREEHEDKFGTSKKFRPRRKLKAGFLNRLFGGAVGSVYGLIFAYILLLPILVIASFVTGISDNLNLVSNDQVELSNQTEIVQVPSIVIEILDRIEEMNEFGLSSITNQIIINEKPVDRLLFDMVFTTQVKLGEDVTDLNWVSELEGVVNIAQAVIELGVLDSNFNYQNISEADLPAIEKVFNAFGNSNLIGYLIPFGTRFGVSNFLPDLIGVDLYEREYSRAAIDEFIEVDWSEEFSNYYSIIEKILEFASVEELMLYANDPGLLLELDPLEAEKFANIFRAIGTLETFALISVAADYATTLSEVQAQIGFISEEEREEYLQERLAFIIQNPQFLNGELNQIANIIEAIFTDEYGDVNLNALVDSSSNLEIFFDQQNPDWIRNILEKIVELETLIEVIPLGIDYGLYSVSGDQISEELAEEIALRLEEIDFQDEILNVGDIYIEVLKLGVGRILGDNPNYYQYIDDIAVNHMDTIREIVSKIFEESAIVGLAIEIASPLIVERFIADEELKSLVLEALISDEESGEVDFNFGLEFNNVLSIVESIYQFTTTEEIANIGSKTPNELVELFANFGSLTNTEYDTLTNAIEDLQILSRLGSSGLEYAKNRFAIEQLYIPENLSLGEEITSILGFAYYAAKYTFDNQVFYNTYEDIDFAPLFNDEVFRSHLLSTELNNHSNLLLSNLAYNLIRFSDDPNLSSYLSVPTSLKEASPESLEWSFELNNLLGFVFDFAGSFEDTDALTLSIREVITLSNDPMQASTKIITQYSDLTIAEKAFGSIDQSVILRSSIKQAIDTFGAQTGTLLGGYEVKTPRNAVENDMLKVNMIVELIHGIASLANDMNQTLQIETLAGISQVSYIYNYIDAYNRLSDQSLIDFSSITLLRGFIGDALLNQDLQQYVRDVVNNTNLVTVSDDFFKFERVDDELTVSDLSELFISVKALQITEPFYANPQAEIFNFLKTLDNDKLDTFFDAKILKEIFTFVLADPGVVSSLSNRVEEAYQNVQASQSLLGAVNPNFESIIGSLGSYKDEDGLFDVNELKYLIRAVNELNVSSVSELSELADLEKLHKKIYNSTFIEELFGGNWLYDKVNYLFTDDSFLEQLASIASSQVLNQTGLEKQFTKENVSFALPKYNLIEVGGSREGGIKVLEIKQFILSATRLNWTGLGLGTGVTLASNLSNKLLEPGTDSVRHIDFILESNLLVAIIDKLLNFEYNGIGMDEVAISFLNTKLVGIPALEGLQLDKEILHYDIRAYDSNQVLRRDEIIEMIEAVSYIDFSNTVGINTFYQMVLNDTFSELFDSYIIHSLISNALTNEDVQAFGVSKVNNAQAIVTLDNDFLSIDPILMDGDLFKVEEMENILIALAALNILEAASFSTIGLSTFSELQGRRVDPDTGEDDFDRVFKANFLYIILDRALKLESLGGYVGTTLGNALEISIDSFDLTPPDAMLGKQVDFDNLLIEEIEVGRIPKAEFGRLFTSFGLLGDIGSIGLDTFISLVDTANPDDDFKTFIESDFIYIILGRMFNLTEFGDYVGNLLSGAFGDDEVDLDMTPPSDAVGQVIGDIEEGLITRVELRKLMVSFKMLGLDQSTDIGVDTILGLIGSDKDENLEDDFDQFLDSIYIQDKISILLLSDPIIELIANGRFEVADFILPPSATITVDGRERLTKQEIYDLFNGLTILGLSDLDGASLGVDTITELEDEEIEDVLESSYLYVVLDLMLKSEDTLVIPLDAYEDSGEFDGMIKKSEILNLLNALDILGITDLNNIDLDTITLDQIVELLDLDSPIVDQLISDAIVEALVGEPDDLSNNYQLSSNNNSTKLGIIDEIPIDAYNADQTRLLRVEMYAMIEVLRVLGIESISDEIDLDTLTIIQLRSVHYLGLGIDPDGDEFESLIVHRLISTSVIEAL
jgi:hypothetical protein